MTNAIQTIITNTVTGTDKLSQTIREVSEMGNEGIFVCAVFCLNIALKKSPIPDKYIPIMTGVIPPIIWCALNGVSGRNVIVGFVCGSVTVHLHQTFRQFAKKNNLDSGLLGALAGPETEFTDKKDIPK